MVRQRSGLMTSPEMVRECANLHPIASSRKRGPSGGTFVWEQMKGTGCPIVEGRVSKSGKQDLFFTGIVFFPATLYT